MHSRSREYDKVHRVSGSTVISSIYMYTRREIIPNPHDSIPPGGTEIMNGREREHPNVRFESDIGANGTGCRMVIGSWRIKTYIYLTQFTA